MSQNQLMNQFTQTPIKGNSATKVVLASITVVVDPNSTNTLLPGDLVKITTTTGNVIYVDKAAATDQGFGFVQYSLKTEKFTANMAVTIFLAGSIFFAEAGAAVTRGAQLEFSPQVLATGPQMIPSAGINPVSAIALDNAAGSGSIFRVMVLFPAVTNLAAAQALATTTPLSVNPFPGGELMTLTPTQTMTLNAAAASLIPNKKINLVITTSGTSSFTITFGTNFKSTGTLATGTTSGKVFVITFVCDGVNYNEVARTTAM